MGNGIDDQQGFHRAAFGIHLCTLTSACPPTSRNLLGIFPMGFWNEYRNESMSVHHPILGETIWKP